MAPSPHDATRVAIDLPAPERHLGFYGLASAPFRAGVDPGRLWLGPEQRAVLETLAEAVRDRGGILLLTGEVGTGKTTLAQRLAATVRPGTEVGWVSSPGAAASDFFEAVLSAYGVRQPVQSASAFAAAFERLLARAGAAGQRVLLVIDEAQALSDDIVDEIGALSAMGRRRPGSLAILLVGETRLDAMLDRDRHAPLRQCIAARCVVPALGPAEVDAYVRHSLDAAGAATEIFDAGALRRIAALSAGAPGAINIICDRALIAGCAKRARPITAAVVDECYPAPGAQAPKPAARPPWTRRPVSFPPPPPRRRARLYLTAAATVLLITGAPYLAWWLIGLDDGKSSNAQRRAATRQDEPARDVPLVAKGDRAGKDAPPATLSADPPAEPGHEVRPSAAALDVPVTLPARALSVRPHSVQARERRARRDARPVEPLGGAGAPAAAPSVAPRVSPLAPVAPPVAPLTAPVPSAAVPATPPAPAAPAMPIPGRVASAPAPPPATAPAPLAAVPASPPVRVPRPVAPLPAPEPAPVARSLPQEVPVSRLPSREPRDDTPDPSAVIDWLVEKSPGRRAP
jgi:type II secretory pathway predicted ATPase ExeA